MYTVNQGPSKLVAKTRTGLSQNYDKIESFRKAKISNAQTAKANANGSSHSSSNGCDNGNKDVDINVAKPVFQQYRRTNSNRNNTLYKNGVRIACFNDEEPQPALSPQYEELIHYIRDSWNVLSAESEDPNEPQSHSSSSSSDRNSSEGSSDSSHSARNATTKGKKKIVVYHNDPPSPALQDFGPFDLESWWGRRLFNNITKSL